MQKESINKIMRKNGVLLHVTSLPSPWGVGTFGKEAYSFVNFLNGSGQSYWQILPINPTSYGDSPYQGYSTFAGNPYMIDFDLLVGDGLLNQNEFDWLDWDVEKDKVDYGFLYNNRFNVLKLATDRFLQKPDPEYAEFLEENKAWLDDYALFMALKKHHNGKAWWDWDEEYKFYSPEKVEAWKEKFKEDFEFQRVLQYFFKKQWSHLKKYANDKGVEIIGDLPIYVARDSVDVWSHPNYFDLDADLNPKRVAGCPPDAFSADGQLWGNPLYNWPAHRENDFQWWIDRIDYATKLYDVVRIDHFRGFDSFYAIPYEDDTARNGEWVDGPGIDLFQAVENKVGKRHIIAEDLGFLTPSVKQLLKDTNFPGMKILQFAFDSRDSANGEYYPFNYPNNSVAYIGTHDNETIAGWFENVDKDDRTLAIEYLGATDPKDYHWAMIRELMKSPSDYAIITAQDLLGLGSEARMNVPSKLGGNWQWRLLPGQLDDSIQQKLLKYTKMFKRFPLKEEEVVEKEEK